MSCADTAKVPELKEKMADRGCDVSKFHVCGGADGVEIYAARMNESVL